MSSCVGPCQTREVPEVQFIAEHCLTIVPAAEDMKGDLAGQLHPTRLAWHEKGSGRERLAWHILVASQGAGMVCQKRPQFSQFS